MNENKQNWGIKNGYYLILTSGIFLGLSFLVKGFDKFLFITLFILGFIISYPSKNIKNELKLGKKI